MRRSSGLDTEIFVARPFVILMTREADADNIRPDERKARLGALAQGVWRNWLEVRAEWQLDSTGKTPWISPEPFRLDRFPSQRRLYDELHEEVKTARKYTPGSQAFYSTETHFSLLPRIRQRDPSIITHPRDLPPVDGSLFRDPLDEIPELLLHRRRAGVLRRLPRQGESLVLGELRPAAAHDEIRRLHTALRRQTESLLPVGTNAGIRSPPDDWILFDVPVLLTLRDKMWTTAIRGTHDRGVPTLGLSGAARLQELSR